MVDAQQRRNEMLRAEIKQLDKQIEEINDLESAKQKFIARMEIIEKLQRSRPQIVHLFDEHRAHAARWRVPDEREADGQAALNSKASRSRARVCRPSCAISTPRSG